MPSGSSKGMPYFGRVSMSEVTKYGCPHWIWNFGLLQIILNNNYSVRKRHFLIKKNSNR